MLVNSGVLQRHRAMRAGALRAWMSIKLTSSGRKTRSIEEQLSKLKEKVYICHFVFGERLLDSE